MSDIQVVYGDFPVLLTMTSGPAKVEVRYDEGGFDPRAEYEHLGTMACAHPRYSLGDAEGSRIAETLRELEGGWSAMYDYLREEYGATVVMPLYLLDHSGVSISCGEPFSAENRGGHYACDPGGWDTSTIGFIFDGAKGREVCGTPASAIADVLRAEVEEYDYWLQGRVYYWVSELEGEELEAVSGYYGEKYAEEAAREELERLLEDYEERAQAQAQARAWACGWTGGFGA